MVDDIRPYRSVLYIPGGRARALEKAREMAVDAIIFDLEDAVAPDEKAAARDTLTTALSAGGYGPRFGLVRINGFDTPWGEDDLAVISGTSPRAILLPKVNNAADIVDLATKLDASGETADTQIWAMMETAQGILNAAEIARAPRMAGFVMGTNDLAAELGCDGRAAMVTALQTCLLAARAAGITCVDGVYNAFKDEDGLRAECLDGRALGMDGKTLIHPAQLAVANEIFAPTADQVDLAQRHIAAWQDAVAQGQGVAVVDGRIVENLHVAQARRILAQVAAIEGLDG